MIKNTGSAFDLKSASHYTWVDDVYRDFMITLITRLEPRYENRKTILGNELEEFNEVTFICRGKIAIGFEINK